MVQTVLMDLARLLLELQLYTKGIFELLLRLFGEIPAQTLPVSGYPSVAGRLE
ncbi:MAG: hypothetical protein ACYDH1_02970 [Anaerolineaceae bacterium]